MKREVITVEPFICGNWRSEMELFPFSDLVFAFFFGFLGGGIFIYLRWHKVMDELEKRADEWEKRHGQA